jgi:hypothetical protein
MKKSTFVLMVAVFAGLMVFPYFSCETSVKEPVVSTEYPDAEEPGTEELGEEEPGAEELGEEEPGAEEPGEEEPGAEEPVTEKPSAEKPSTEKPGAEEPSTEKPSTEKPSAEEPVTEKPGAEEPVTEKPSAEEPGAEKPSAEEPGTEIAPEVAEIFFLRKKESGTNQYLPYDTDEYWNNIVTGACGFIIVFDQEMDLSKPKGSLLMEPARDYTATAANNKTLEVYFEAGASPVKKISLTVKADMRSLTGGKLGRDYTFGFTEWKSSFLVTRIKINGGNAVPLNQLDTPYPVEAEYHQGNWFTEVEVQFNAPLDYATAERILSEIELVPADERIGNAPDIYEAGYGSPNYENTWTGMEFGSLDSPYRYLLKIPGGIDGINDDYGFYLKEDLILMLDVFSK